MFTLDEVLIYVKSVRDDAKTYDPEDITEPGCDNPSIDVRLQLFEDGQWSFHSGDSSYDQDHRGFWGSGSIGPDDDDEACADVARALIDDVAESVSQANSFESQNDMIAQLEKIGSSSL